MVADVVTQMRGRSGKRQVKKADIGLTHTLGGPGSIACVFVLGRP
jgi:acetyl-CoA C-acetyltransferase